MWNLYSALYEDTVDFFVNLVSFFNFVLVIPWPEYIFNNQFSNTNKRKVFLCIVSIVLMFLLFDYFYSLYMVSIMSF